LPYGGIRFGLDACLGVKGIPQSATGQTAIYTGVNTAKQIRKHLFGFPNLQLKKIIADKSIFSELISAGNRCKFVNAFRPIFFTSPELFENIRLSATSEMNRCAGLSFAKIQDIKKGSALYHDFSNQELIQKGFNLPIYNSRTAANILVELSETNDLILYEYFLTDAAGHSKNMELAVAELMKIESLIFNVLEEVQNRNVTVIVCSDHGNLEDIRYKSHTLNPAYFAIWTKNEIKRIKSLIEIKQLIIQIITNQI
jgi:hypothetical protein